MTTKGVLAPERLRAELPLLADLPAFPPLMAQLSATVGRDDVGLAEVEELVARDPVIAARLVSAANAVIYADHVPVTSVRAALLRLGLVRVRRLAMLLSFYNAMSRKDGLGDRFWRHSLAVSHAVESLAEHAPVRVDNVESLVLGGLMHDIGILVVATHFAKAHADVAIAGRERGTPRDSAERDILGVDHAEIGACLAEHWGLARDIVSAIRFHHRPMAAPSDDALGAALFRSAEAIVETTEQLSVGENVRLVDDDPVLATLGIKGEDVARAVTAATNAAKTGALLLDQLR